MSIDTNQLIKQRAQPSVPQTGIAELAAPGAQQKIAEMLFTGKKPEGASHVFANALVGLLPTIAGALFMGDAGTAIGAKAGVTAMGELSKSDIEERKLAGEKDKIHQELLTKGILTDEKFPVESAKLKLGAANANLRAAELNQGEQRMSAQQDRFNKNHALEVAKASQTSEKQTSDFEQMAAFKRDLDQLGLHKLDNTGPVEGQIKSVANSMGLSVNKDFDSLKNDIANMVAMRIHAISGTASSKSEAARLEEGLPSVADSHALFVHKLKAVEERSRRYLDTKASITKAGQPLKTEAVDRIMNATNSTGMSKAERLKALLK